MEIPHNGNNNTDNNTQVIIIKITLITKNTFHQFII